MKHPHAVHAACHEAHVRFWPLRAKVWIAWGAKGWRPAVVVGHRKTRVVVRVDDGLWPFDGSSFARKRGTATVAPNRLRVRKTDDTPQERATSNPSCVALTGFVQGVDPQHVNEPLTATPPDLGSQPAPSFEAVPIGTPCHDPAPIDEALWRASALPHTAPEPFDLPLALLAIRRWLADRLTTLATFIAPTD